MHFVVEFKGAFSYIRPQTATAMRRLADVAPKGTMWVCGALAVEDGKMWSVVKGLELRGFKVGGDE